jgi:MFS transporter, OFA family, oxalate/formate antiporter
MNLPQNANKLAAQAPEQTPSNKLVIAGNWPFDVSKSPVFYGWVVWFISTLGFLMSIPGQTMGMAVFTDTFIEVLGLSRTELSVAYLLGTIGSSFFLTRAGRLYDRIGARIIVIASSLALALTLVAISRLDLVSRSLSSFLQVSFVAITFPAIVLCYFGVRLSGQGILTNACRNVLLVWFEKRRGFVGGLRGVFVSLGFSISPLVLAWMIAQFGWRGALTYLAVMIGIVFVIIAAIFLRDTPESCGVLPDGKIAGPESEFAAETKIAGMPLVDAKKNAVFWVYSLALGLYGLFITAVTFHIVAIFAEVGRSSVEAFAYFLPQAIFSTLINLSASWFADSRPLKPFLLLLLLGLIVGSVGVLNLHQWYGYWLMILGFGTGGGLWGLISNLAFIRHFGRKHLGEISGFNISIAVFASAIGPLLFSLGFDIFNTFAAALWLSIAMTSALLVVAIKTNLSEPARA